MASSEGIGVTEIRFELVANGKRKRMIFLRPEGIELLLTSEHTIGSFLRKMRDDARQQPTGDQGGG